MTFTSSTGGISISDELDRHFPLFENAVHFRLVVGDKEARYCDLFVRVLSGTRTIGSSRPQKILAIEITDESDPYFLHSLVVGENEFSELKAEQSIFVDFSAFPAHLIELFHETRGTNASRDRASGLDATIPGDFLDRSAISAHSLNNLSETHHSPVKQTSPRANRSPSFAGANRFYCQLVVRDTTPGSPSLLSIIETNAFKQLTHIQLSLRVATDAILKKYLASRFSHVKGVLEDCQSHLTRSQMDCQTLKEQLQEANQTIMELKASVQSREAAVRAKADSDIAQLTMNLSQLRLEAEEKRTKEIAALQAKHDESIALMAKQLSELKTELLNATEELSKTKEELFEEKRAQKYLQDDLQRTIKERDSLLSAKESLYATNTASNKDINSLSLKLAVAEQSVADLKEIVANNKELLASTEASKQLLEEQLVGYKASYTRMQEKLESSVNEIHKGNEIIQRLQDEIRNNRAKIKSQEELCKTNEDRISDSNARIADLKREIESLKADLAREREKNESLNIAYEGNKQQLQQAKNQLEQNAQVIAWLNKELNEQSIYPLHGTQTSIPALYSSPSKLTSGTIRTNAGGVHSTLYSLSSSRSKSPFATVSTVPSTTNLQSSTSTALPSASSSAIDRTSPSLASKATSIASTPTLVPSAASHSSGTKGASPAPRVPKDLPPSASREHVGLASVTKSSNPYLAGTVPLAEALAAKGLATPSAYFPTKSR